MRVMVFVKATADSEQGLMPTEQMFLEMGRYNEELVKAGILLAGDGLQPSSRGKRVRFSGSRRTSSGVRKARATSLIDSLRLCEIVSVHPVDDPCVVVLVICGPPVLLLKPSDSPRVLP